MNGLLRANVSGLGFQRSFKAVLGDGIRFIHLLGTQGLGFVTGRPGPAGRKDRGESERERRERGDPFQDRADPGPARRQQNSCIIFLQIICFL